MIYGLLFILSISLVFATLLLQRNSKILAQAPASDGMAEISARSYLDIAAAAVFIDGQYPAVLTPWLYHLTLAPAYNDAPSTEAYHPAVPLILAIVTGMTLFLLFITDIGSQFGQSNSLSSAKTA